MLTIEKIWLTDDAVHIKCSDGRTAAELFSDYPRLRDASPEERANYSYDKFGIHWPGLNEDLEFDSFFKDKSKNELYMIFINHPELNASAVARRLGMSQSLLAQYISGAKHPSDARLNEIISCIHTIGLELCQV
ncbi:MAG: DUF2442 domain-containing protein [Bacteroidales bacterium]|nr:DUF2442 domain-containing protein [Bacteroidales bacterium]